MIRRPPRSTLFPYTTALPISGRAEQLREGVGEWRTGEPARGLVRFREPEDRKSTRLNSSHLVISYAVFCLKKKKQNVTNRHVQARRFNSSLARSSEQHSRQII